MLLVVLTLSSLFLYTRQLSPNALLVSRQTRTERALLDAREALVAYAQRVRDLQAAEDTDRGGDDDAVMYGFLPLPDLGSSRNTNTACPSEGCEANTPDSVAYDANGVLPTLLGRLPWRTLGIAPLRDGDGECLWLMVSSLHLRKRLSMTNPSVPALNADTLGQLEIVVADGSTNLASVLSNAHDRATAVIFAPGPPLPGQNRTESGTDAVDECGGNYDAANYLDPVSLASLNGVGNALTGVQHAAATTGDSDRSNDPDLAKALVGGGRLARMGDGKLRAGTCQAGGDCVIVANDGALPLTPNRLFSDLRRNPRWRSDLNDLLAAGGNCLDAAGAYAPIAMSGTGDAWRGRAPDATQCAFGGFPPGYFAHYREYLLTAVSGNAGAINACRASQGNGGTCLDVTLTDPVSGVVTNKKCHGVLIYAGERSANQSRVSAAERNTPGNYLEGGNLSSFSSAGQRSYSGLSRLPLTGTSVSPSADIVRCIPEAGYSTANPNGDSLLAVVNPAVNSIGQLSNYDAPTRSLTLGTAYATNRPNNQQTELYGCAWSPESRSLGSGLRSYFKFRINDAGTGGITTPIDGFSFAVVDADANGALACGAARQHLGYGGGNLDTAPLVAPKIGVEFDFRTNSNFDVSGSNTLTNGRNDPGYAGGHVGIVYWGATTDFATNRNPNPGQCASPMYVDSGICYLPASEDDNVHGQPSACSLTPANPPAPASPTLGAGVYKLDPNLSSVPVNQEFHVRVEITRGSLSSRATVVRLAAPATMTIAAPGTGPIDGTLPSLGDRILLANQANSADNGVYVWNGDAAPMTRSADADTTDELDGMVVQVASGDTQSGSVWRQSALHIDGALDSDPIIWCAHNAAQTPQVYLTQVWLLPESPTTANQIAAMKDTSRPMESLYPGFSAHVRDQALIYHPFTRARLGFTVGQSTTRNDQTVSVTNHFSTWLD